MKSFLIKMLAVAALFTGSLLQGYAIVYSSKSPVPYVDIYTYKADNFVDALKKHEEYASKFGIAKDLFDKLESAREATGKVAAVADKATEGIASKVQKGAYIGIDVAKFAYNQFKNDIDRAIATIAGGKNDNAFHEKVSARKSWPWC